MSPEAVQLIIYAGIMLVFLVIVVRGEIRRARRKRIAAHLLDFWKRKLPGALISKCPQCRLPYPVKMEVCPYCENSRRRARALRRDVDWVKETYPRTYL